MPGQRCPHLRKQSSLVSDSVAAFIALCSAHGHERLEDPQELHRTVRYLQSRDTGKDRLSHIVSLRRPCPEDAFYVPRILRTWLYTEGLFVYSNSKDM